MGRLHYFFDVEEQHRQQLSRRDDSKDDGRWNFE
jgi:hypothetical protein